MTQELQILEKLSYDPNDVVIKLPRHTDKIILPENILNTLVNLQKQHDLSKLPHPLVFRLSTPSHNTYVGVKEFHDQNDESVYLSDDVCERLGILQSQDNVQLSIELALNVSNINASLEKAIIEVMPKQNYKVRDWKAFLESTLSASYTAVTTNDILTFIVDKQEYVLDVVSVKTSNNIRTVCVVDRDIELEIRLPENVITDEHLNDDYGEYTDLFDDKSGTMSVSKRVKLKLNPGERFKCDGEFLLAFDQFVDLGRFEYGSMSKPYKEWTNQSDDEVIIYVYALGIEKEGVIENVNFSISGDKENDQDDEIIDAGSVKCQYCGNIIQKSSQILHENFCKRNNILCPNGCGKIFFKSIPLNHWHCCSTYGDGEWHKNLHVNYIHDEMLGFTCSQCNDYHCKNKYTLCEHISRDCPGAVHECRYCHLIIPRGIPTEESKFYGVSAHERSCGAKTTECFKCNKIIKLRDLETHLKLHELNKLDRIIPTKCSNELCVNIIDKLTNSNPISLCQNCYSSLYSTIHDPDGTKLMQRIERRYILQIKNGCGSKSCENSLCGSSLKCEISDNIRNNMVEIVKFVKTELMNNLNNDNHEWTFEFCVPQSMNQRRHLINMFKNGEWETAWICKSNEIEGNNFDSMQRWLENNAVKCNIGN
jgi:hypothetical protein